MDKLFIKSPLLLNEFLRISTQIINYSLNEIKTNKIDNDILVHTLRKRVKNLRAILKFLRKEFGENFYKRNNFLLRDINRRSASIRNYAALIRLVKLNEDKAEDKSLKEALNLLGIRLNSDIQNIQANTDYTALFRYYESQFDKYQSQLKKIDDTSYRFANIKSGLIKIYSEGRDLYNLCVSDQNEDRLHEWRKSVKDFYYVSFSLVSIWENIFKPYNKEIKLLSDMLGDVNDYYELNHYIQSLVDNPYDFTLLFDLIENNRQKLINESYQIGSRIFTSEPESLGEQFKSYYLIFKKEQ
jgi:hypothetical protein